MKKNLGPINPLYPLPTVLVGAMVEGRANFMPVAHVGLIDFDHVSMSMARVHYTNEGIRQTQVFSVNFPTEAQVRETDYCGLVSGKKTDKSGVFTIAPGPLTGAPLIEECPLVLECRVAQVLEMPRHEVFIGRILATYAEESCLTEGKVDYAKLKPLLFTMSDKGYWSLGARLADAWRVGQGLKARRPSRDS